MQTVRAWVRVLAPMPFILPRWGSLSTVVLLQVTAWKPSEALILLGEKPLGRCGTSLHYSDCKRECIPYPSSVEFDPLSAICIHALVLAAG
jgi:hypothetical protein